MQKHFICLLILLIELNFQPFAQSIELVKIVKKSLSLV
jgi:hypothetical protein